MRSRRDSPLALSLFPRVRSVRTRYIWRNKAGASAAELSWGNARVFNGDLAEGIRELKAEPGKTISAIGGAGFMRSLIVAHTYHKNG